jgi:hypothetical protein
MYWLCTDGSLDILRRMNKKSENHAEDKTSDVKTQKSTRDLIAFLTVSPAIDMSIIRQVALFAEEQLSFRLEHRVLQVTEAFSLSVTWLRWNSSSYDSADDIKLGRRKISI